MPTDLDIHELAGELLRERIATLERKQQKRLERIATASEAVASNTERQVYRNELSVAERARLVADLGQEKYLALPYRRP